MSTHLSLALTTKLEGETHAKNEHLCKKIKTVNNSDMQSISETHRSEYYSKRNIVIIIVVIIIINCYKWGDDKINSTPAFYRHTKQELANFNNMLENC